MTPPARRPAEPHQPRGLGGDAVRRHELLLLADGAQEAERMHAEPEQPDERERQQRRRTPRAPGARAPAARWCEHEERQHAGRRVTLMPDTGGQRRRAAAQVAAPAPAVSASAPASASISSVSLCAPPTASTSSTGFRPTNAAAQPGECPSRAAARAINATAPMLDGYGERLERPQPPRGSERHQRVAQRA